MLGACVVVFIYMGAGGTWVRVVQHGGGVASAQTKKKEAAAPFAVYRASKTKRALLMVVKP